MQIRAIPGDKKNENLQPNRLPLAHQGTGAEGQPGSTKPSPVSHQQANASLVKTTPGIQ
jgi:hypothetical protein